MEIPFSYNVLTTFFEEDIPSPSGLVDLITYHSFEVAEVTQEENDTKITIDVLPNRAHDCLSYYFFAKEIAALTGKKLKPVPQDVVEGSGAEAPRVTIEEPELCSRYMARKIENIHVKESPEWLSRMMEQIGQKSINNVVDATNFVLWVYNQPTHAFDANKVNGGISIRKAKKDEGLTTLDKKEVSFTGDELIISDEESPLAIAGVKGGDKAEVTEDTTNIILEIANFDPVSVRKTSRALGISTDSSKRFEHHISPELAGDSMGPLTQMIVNLAGGETTKVSDIVDEYPRKQEKKELLLSNDTVNKILGTTLSESDIKDIFEKLSFECECREGVFTIVPPKERLDINATEDLVEEVGRMYGYNNITSEPIHDMDFSPRVSKEYYYQMLIENILRDTGFSQIETYTLLDSGELEIENPLASDKGYFRSNMTDLMSFALLRNIRNQDLLGLQKIRLFEFGRVFRDNKEINILTVMASKKDDIDKVYLLLKNQFGEPEVSKGDVHFEGAKIGDSLEIVLDDFMEKLPEPEQAYDVLEGHTSPSVKYKTPSKYPFVTRDIAVWVPKETKQEEVLSLIEKEAGELLVQKRLFDTFEKEGNVSFAFNLVFQSSDKTLSDEEVNTVMEKVTGVLNAKEGWSVR